MLFKFSVNVALFYVTCWLKKKVILLHAERRCTQLLAPWIVYVVQTGARIYDAYRPLSTYVWYCFTYGSVCGANIVSQLKYFSTLWPSFCNTFMLQLSLMQRSHTGARPKHICI